MTRAVSLYKTNGHTICMQTDEYPYTLTIVIPTTYGSGSVTRAYQDREDLTEFLFNQGGRWLGSGFGQSRTSHIGAFDIMLLYKTENAAKQAVTMALNWLRNRNYPIGTGETLKYDGKVHVFWRPAATVDSVGKA